MGIFNLDCVQPDDRLPPGRPAGLRWSSSWHQIPFYHTLVESSGDAIGENHNQQSLGDSNSRLVLLGVLLTVLSCAATALGTVLQKKVHNQEKLKEDQDRSRAWKGIPLNLKWLRGLIIMVFIPLPLEFTAFAIAPQSLIAPFAGLTIILNQIFAAILLPEKITRVELLSTVFIVCGLVCIALAAGGGSKQYTYCHIIERYSEPDFFIPSILLLAAIFVNWYFINYKDAPRVSWERCRPFMFAFIAAGFNAFVQTFFKALAEMTRAAISDGEKVFLTIYPYVHLVFAIGGGILVISYINRALAQYDTIVFTPLYICNLIVLSSLFGSIFYDEYKTYGYGQYVLWIAGMLLVCFGVAVLSFKRPVVISRGEHSGSLATLHLLDPSSDDLSNIGDLSGSSSGSCSAEDTVEFLQEPLLAL